MEKLEKVKKHKRQQNYDIEKTKTNNLVKISKYSVTKSKKK